jgi:hypothetical protein
VSTGIDPDGYPAVFEGGGWVSHDRRYRWNGVGWTPIVQPSTVGPWLKRAGVGLLFLAVIGYTVYSLGANQAEYTAGFIVGMAAYFAVLFVIFRAVGNRWGCFGAGIRIVMIALAALRILAIARVLLPH